MASRFWSPASGPPAIKTLMPIFALRSSNLRRTWTRCQSAPWSRCDFPQLHLQSGGQGLFRRDEFTQPASRKRICQTRAVHPFPEGCQNLLCSLSCRDAKSRRSRGRPPTRVAHSCVGFGSPIDWLEDLQRTCTRHAQCPSIALRYSAAPGQVQWRVSSRLPRLGGRYSRQISISVCFAQSFHMFLRDAVPDLVKEREKFVFDAHGVHPIYPFWL